MVNTHNEREEEELEWERTTLMSRTENRMKVREKFGKWALA